jgi:hypothetical protein
MSDMSRLEAGAPSTTITRMGSEDRPGAGLQSRTPQESGDGVDPLREDVQARLLELERFLVDEPPERRSGLVLVLASSWVLGESGLDVERCSREARAFRNLTPEHDRVLASFPDAIASYLVYRMMTNEREELKPELGAQRLERARAALALRAQRIEEDYPLVADGFRRLLDETAGGKPPYDPLWHALARRIGDRGLPDWQVRAAG